MPISDCEVRDPRTRRTRNLLQSALRTLMQTRSLDEISVQDITHAATVNRVTFYDHYTDKFALLEAMIAGGFHQLLRDRNVSFDGTCPAAVRAIILAACDYLTLSHSGAPDTPCQRHQAFQPLMDSAIVAAIRRVLIDGVRARHTNPHLSAEIIVAAASWAIVGAVKEWFYTPHHPPADSIVPAILQVVLPVLQAAG